MPSLANVAMHFFLQLAVILAAYRLLWPLFKRLGQVQVVAIMVAGFALGPSLLGWLAPDVQSWIFPQKVVVDGVSVTHPSLTALYVVGQFGLVLYMFVVGMSFDTGIFRNHVRHAAVTSLAGIIAPMVLGGAVGWFFVDRLFADDIAGWQAALFMAAAVSITAFPMLAWIVYDTGLLKTRLGTVALACAAADDAVAWILLAAVVASTKSTALGAALALVGGLVYLTVMLTAGRRLLGRLGSWSDRQSGDKRTLPVGALVTTMLVLLAGAWFTDYVGIYAVFGAFIAGVAMPRGVLADTLRERIEPLTAYVLVPAFFVYSGLNTDLNLMLGGSMLAMLALILVVSFLGKGVAVGIAGRLQGMNWNEAGSLGALMNARGLMELILLNIGLTAGIVTPELYTLLAVMTIVTTFAASPVHKFFDRRGQRAAARTAASEVPQAADSERGEPVAASAAEVR